MGRIVAAFGVAHAPQILAAPETEDQAQLAAVHAAFESMRQTLVARRPEAFLIIGNDHLESFFLDAFPALAVYTGLRCEGSFGRYTYAFPVHEALSSALLHEAIAAGFDLAFSQEAVFGHEFLVPMHFVLKGLDIPVVPIFVNGYVPPQPLPRRCYDFGAALARIIEHRPESVAVMATGGLSHYPGTERYGNPDFEFDRRILRLVEAGGVEEIVAISAEELDAAGNVELRSWITLLGMIGKAPGTVLTYQRSWHHGYAMVSWDLT